MSPPPPNLLHLTSNPVTLQCCPDSALPWESNSSLDCEVRKRRNQEVKYFLVASEVCECLAICSALCWFYTRVVTSTKANIKEVLSLPVPLVFGVLFLFLLGWMFQFLSSFHYFSFFSLLLLCFRVPSKKFSKSISLTHDNDS